MPMFYIIGSDVIAVMDSNRMDLPSIYLVNCEVLISQGSSRCDCCKKHRKSWCAMASRYRKDDITNPSGHTTYDCLSAQGKKDRMSRLQKEKRKLSLRVNQLEEKLAAARERDSITLTNELHNDMEKIAASCTKQVHSNYPEGSFQRLFWDQQIQASKYTNSKSMKWHPIFYKMEFIFEVFIWKVL